MATVYYRYITDVQERNQLITERVMLSMNPRTNYETWYAPTRYDDPALAQRQLALPAPILPIYRVGPVPETAIQNLTVGPRRIAPAYGQPGGGLEIATQTPVYLFGIWSFALNAFDSTL